MEPQAYFTLATVLVLFLLLIKNFAPPDFAFMAATSLLVAMGIITPADAFAGFGNSGVLAVAAMFVVAAGLRETGILDLIGHHVLGKAKSDRMACAKLAPVVVPMSAFLNNTPIVAMFMPVVIDWSRRHHIAPSKVLLPLSYLTILGGTCTLIGTSTNLVVNGLMIENGLPGMGLFELSWIGIPYAMIGVAYLLTVGIKLLPDRRELMEQLGESRREYIAEMVVGPGCRLIGNTVEGSGLRGLQGLFLVEIERNNDLIAPVQPDQVLQRGDRLVFTGIVASIVELETMHGLIPSADPNYELAPHEQRRRRVWEAVVSPSSPLVGKSLREADFRATYGAAVIAVHRDGQRVAKKLGEIVLRPGDTLLLQAGPHFRRAFRNDPAFHLISDVSEWRPLRRDLAWVAATIFVALIVAMTVGVVPTEVAAILAAVAMVGTRCITAGDARQLIDWQVLVTIAASFGVGKALQNSGAATTMAALFVDATKSLGPLAGLASVYLLGSLVTEVITNNAAAVLMFPFCLEISRLYGVSPMPFMIALILSASASFMTPIGYQTNMMVYGPGGYRFADFLRVGTPLNLLLWVTASVLIPRIWPF